MKAFSLSSNDLDQFVHTDRSLEPPQDLGQKISILNGFGRDHGVDHVLYGYEFMFPHIGSEGCPSLALQEGFAGTLAGLAMFVCFVEMQYLLRHRPMAAVPEGKRFVRGAP